MGAAKIAMAAHDYIGTFDHARRAYEYVRSAAAKTNVTVTASTDGWKVLSPTKGKQANKKDYSYQDKYGPTEHRSAP